MVCRDHVVVAGGSFAHHRQQLGIVARDTERRRKRLYRLDGLSETHLERRQQLSRRPIPRVLVHVLCEVIGTGLLVLPESIGHRAGDQLRGSEVLRDGQRILDIAVGRGEVVLAICRQCPQVVHVRVLRGNLPQCIKGYDRFLQLVRGDLCPRGVATGNRIPRLDGDYASVSPFGRVVIVLGKGEIAL